MRPIHLTAIALSFATSLSAQDASYREIGPQNVDLRNGGVRGKADWLRYKLVEVNGPTGGYILAPGNGDQAGYVGTINRLIGGGGLGSLLNEASIGNCAEIPTSGNLSGTLEIEAEDGERETLNATAHFGLGNRPIPAHFDGSGSSFEKLIVMTDGGRPVLEVQLSCAADSPLMTGYFWRPAAEENDRNRELYFQRNTETGLNRVEVYFTYEPWGEHYGFRFETLTGEVVRIWNIRSVSDTSRGSPSGFAVTYRPDSGLAMTSFLFGNLELDDTTSLASGALECLSLETNDAAGECEAQDLAITDPMPTPAVGDAVVPFNIAGMTSMTLRSGLPEIPQASEPIPNDAGATPGEADAGL